MRARGWLARRTAVAPRAHASRVLPLRQRVGRETGEQWWSTEAFVDAATFDSAHDSRPAQVLASAESLG